MIVLTSIFLLLIIILGILLWIPYYYWRDLDIKSMPGPYSYPILGILYEFKDPKKIFEKLSEFHKKFGPTFRGYFLNELNVITTDVDLIEFALTNPKTINKGTAYDYLHNWLGTGLLTSGNEKWRRRRKMITPAYHFQVLDQFVEMFERNSNIMIKKLRGEIDKPQTDIFPFVNLCALDTICETAMGTCMNAQVKSDSEFVRATKEMNRIVLNRGFDFWKAFDLTYVFTADYQKEKEALKVIHGYTMQLIKLRRDELIKAQAEQQFEENDEAISKKRKDNFLDLLLKSTVDGEPMSNEDIREEVDTFTFEGHDTVSSAISFALYLISNHPEIQERLVLEQKDIFANNPHRQTNLADLKQMKYLEIVIKETLRLYPSVPMIVREVTEDIHYKDWLLKKGTQIVVYIYELHRNASVFPEPDKFIPERFLAENQAARHPFSYIPFSASHRNCIGQKFAMLEMLSSIAKILRNFELDSLTPKHHPCILPELILRSENGVLLKLKPRKW